MSEETKVVRQIAAAQRLKDAAKVTTTFSSFSRIGLLAIYPQLEGKEIHTFRTMLDHNANSSRLKDFLEIRSQGIEKFASSVLDRTSKKKGVSGNLAGLEYFPRTGPTWGVNKVGASPNAVEWLKDSDFKQADVPINFESYEAREDRKQDSEYLLITELTYYLETTRTAAEPSGHTVLLTETLPCISCAGVINQFLRRFPSITMTIAYAVPTQKDEDYAREAKFAASLAVDPERCKLLRLVVIANDCKREGLHWNLVAEPENTQLSS